MSTCIEYAVHQFTDRFQFQVPRDHEAIRFLCLGLEKSKIRVKAGENAICNIRVIYSVQEGDLKARVFF